MIKPLTITDELLDDLPELKRYINLRLYESLIIRFACEGLDFWFEMTEEGRIERLLRGDGHHVPGGITGLLSSPGRIITK